MREPEACEKNVDLFETKFSETCIFELFLLKKSSNYHFLLLIKYSKTDCLRLTKWSKPPRSDPPNQHPIFNIYQFFIYFKFHFPFQFQFETFSTVALLRPILCLLHFVLLSSKVLICWGQRHLKSALFTTKYKLSASYCPCPHTHC